MMHRQSEHQPLPTSSSTTPDSSTLAFLLTHEFQQAFHAWDAQQPARDGLHASSVLESDSDFCTRQHVLADAFPAERQTKDQYLPALQKFLHGWNIHEKWQYKLLKPTCLVAVNEHGQLELDLTHIDPDTGIKYSPDVILAKFAGLTLPIEIKGINHEDYAGQEEMYYKVVIQVADRQYGVSYVKAQDARPGIVGATLAEAAERNKSIRSAIPQLNLYLHLLGLTDPPNNRGIILIEDKNTQDFTLWVHVYDAALVEKPLHRAMDVRTAKQHFDFNDGDLPSRICATRNDSRAKRCPFRDACFSRANGGTV